jgi:hypothetical protein
MRLHRYGGKENGLMIIGSESELRRLGEALLSLKETSPDRLPGRWPRSLATFSIDTSPDFKLSFHLDIPDGDVPASNFPRRLWPFG